MKTIIKPLLGLGTGITILEPLLGLGIVMANFYWDWENAKNAYWDWENRKRRYWEGLGSEPPVTPLTYGDGLLKS